jgi:uncharacterized protein YjbI with pentapeptide repeats
MDLKKTTLNGQSSALPGGNRTEANVVTATVEAWISQNAIFSKRDFSKSDFSTLDFSNLDFSELDSSKSGFYKIIFFKN